MATIALYSFAKKSNSTARPTGTGTALSGNFIMPLDVTAPVVDVQQAGTILTNGYNYAYIYSLDRYYFIDNIEMLTTDLCRLYLREDYLASWKTSIGASSQYVLRSASQSNGNIMDTMYPMLTNPIIYTDNITSQLPWLQAGSAGNLQNGYYVIGIINTDSNAYGSVSYYGLNQAGFDDLKSKMFSSVNWTNMQFSDIEEALYKSLFNPFQYIASCMWFPMQPPLKTASSFTFDIGYFQLGVLAGTARQLDSFTSSGSFTLSAYNHPQLSDGAFVNKAPFAKRRVYVQPFGVIDLDCDPLASANHVITCTYYVDYISGNAYLRFTDSNGIVIGEAGGQLGVPIQMSASQQDIIGGVTGAVNAVGAVTSSYLDIGKALGGAANAISSIGSAASAMAPSISSIGVNGSPLVFAIPAIYQCTFYNTVQRDNADRGSPLCEVKTLNTLSGFMLCSDVKLEISSALGSEISALKGALESGIYYE